MSPGTYDPNATINGIRNQLPQMDSTTGGVPNQAGSGQIFNQTMGKGGQAPQQTTTNAATSGQPQMGQPNTYSNTVGPWDNSNNQTQVQSGKGKGH